MLNAVNHDESTANLNQYRAFLTAPLCRNLLGLAAWSRCWSPRPSEPLSQCLFAAMGGYRKPVLELIEAFRKKRVLKRRLHSATSNRSRPRLGRIGKSFLIGDKSLLEPTGLFSSFDRLGTGRLVLVSSKGKSLSSLDELKNAAFTRVAIPHRTRTVFGRAADECVKRLHLADALAPSCSRLKVCLKLVATSPRAKWMQGS
jgi:molybdate transport system substrate-binding protein